MLLLVYGAKKAYESEKTLEGGRWWPLTSQHHRHLLVHPLALRLSTRSVLQPDLGKKQVCSKKLRTNTTVSFFTTTKSLQKSLELCARVRSVLQHLHTFPHPCTPPIDAVLNQQRFAKKQADTLRNHIQSLLGWRARGFLQSRVATTGRTWWEAPLMGGSRSRPEPAGCKNPPRLYHMIAPCTTNSCAIWCELLLLCSVLSE